MKTVDYINTLIKEKEELKTLCKRHVATIQALKRELVKIKVDITKKDKKIQSLENSLDGNKMQDNIDRLNNELNDLRVKNNELLHNYELLLKRSEGESKTKGGSSKLKSEYNILKRKYDEVVKENEELKSIFDDIDKICESDEQ
jgi:predicted  nucleic acid-binding Zn-ribbon protein